MRDGVIVRRGTDALASMRPGQAAPDEELSTLQGLADDLTLQ